MVNGALGSLQSGEILPPVKRPRGRPKQARESLERARARKESALATIREMEVAKRQGDLLEAETVARAWQDVLRRVRAAMLAVPARIRQKLPHLTGHDLLVLDRELRDALEAMADGEADAGPGDGAGDDAR